MRRFCIAFVAGLAVGLTAATVLTAQIDIRQQAPLDRAVDFPTAEIDAIIAEMDAAGRVTTRLLEGGSYNVNIRRISNAETALMHPRTTDVYVVREGSGTLVTGGRIVDERGEAPDSIVASRVRDGEVDRTRPHCPYPQQAVYTGSGSTDDAGNFVCRAP